MVLHITSWQEAAKQCQTWKKQGDKVVFTNGCFDLLHPGHITYLEDAKALGQHLIVGLNADDSIRRLKGESRPINVLNDRGHMLMGLQAVDMVVAFDEGTPLHLIQTLMPDVLVKGGDYEVDNIVGAKEVVEHGGIVRVVPFLPGYSSSQLIARIKGA
ncbi:MAG: D-glycero-beta-D-manno-heptose 1-phosphate adenylyltransferase [Mariprofundaceae bacterium]|nr:D-glycero-beta-D-manno-heptose 1-phosphate adenylyltransferase [Mariprofundaceae bacterium]